MGYSKRFVASAIDLKNRYWNDPFVRSEINVIVLHLVFAFSAFIIASIFFNYIYQDVSRTMVSGITGAIASKSADSSKIVTSLEVVKLNRFLVFSSVMLIFSLSFTYLVAKITLRPVKRALDSQKRFISDIAHELRTPLSIIRTNSEVYLLQNEMDEEVKEVVRSNIEELDRISSIINNLLSLKKLVRPDKMKFNGVDLGPIIDSAISKLKEAAEKKSLEITVKKVSPYVVWGNNVALEQIVTNLLTNAINYTRNGGSITVRVGPDYLGNIVLHIEDTGIGITKADLLHIFEPFYRAERSRDRRRGSSGLGLTIVSELVKMHSGRITVRSAENRGTVAIVTLPYPKQKNLVEEKVDLSDLNEISVNFSQKSEVSSEI